MTTNNPFIDFYILLTVYPLVHYQHHVQQTSSFVWLSVKLNGSVAEIKFTLQKDIVPTVNMFQLETIQVRNLRDVSFKFSSEKMFNFWKNVGTNKLDWAECLGVCQQASSSNVIYKDCFASCNGKEAGNANCNDNNDVVKMFEDDKVGFLRWQDCWFESN